MYWDTIPGTTLGIAGTALKLSCKMCVKEYYTQIANVKNMHCDIQYYINLETFYIARMQ